MPEIPQDLCFKILDSLRTAHVYALKDSHPEELGGGFKPWKWDGYEIEYARKATDTYIELLEVLKKEVNNSESS